MSVKSTRKLYLHYVSKLLRKRRIYNDGKCNELTMLLTAKYNAHRKQCIAVSNKFPPDKELTLKMVTLVLFTNISILG